MAPKPDTSELQPYLDAGNWQLLPLHRFDAVMSLQSSRGRTIEKPRGKSPVHKNWTVREYDSKACPKHMRKGGNVGVRLKPGQLVIDVDPRNFEKGDDPLERLAKDFDLELDEYPTVITGSGGKHIYLRKPSKLSTVDTLENYKGVEFKTVGRQVVAAGSIHPDTRKTYKWDTWAPHISAVPPAPLNLLKAIRRPKGSAPTGAGRYSKEQLGEMLAGLDPVDFQDHDEWFKLMQACHHATSGDGRDEFVEWSTSDPEFADDDQIIGMRWDSLHADSRGSRVTYKTLNRMLLERGAGATIPRDDASEDFGGPEDLDEPPEEADPDAEPPKSLLEEMNQKYWAVMDHGKFRIMYQELDPTQQPPRHYWVRAGKQDFDLLYANRRMQGKGNNVVPMSQAWLEWAHRRDARGVVFDPEHTHPGYLNLWTGWAYDPAEKADGWKLLEEMLFEVLCDGDQEMFEYALNWSSYMVQHPNTPAEVALCFQGPKGIGKGTFGRALVRLAGRHGMQITSADQLTGRFNDHLRDLILLFADEAVKPYDKSAESRLKGLITEPTQTYEGKGRDAVHDRNRLHIVMASNEEWFVPVDMVHERRFAVTRGNTKWQNKLGRFSKLNKELENGGYASMLFDLLHRDIEGWAPRQGIPKTKALVEQKMRNLDPIPQWWADLLMEGQLGMETIDDQDWEDGPVKIFKHDMRESFVDFCRQRSIKAGGMNRLQETSFAKELMGMCGGIKAGLRCRVPDERMDEVAPDRSHRAKAYELPSLPDCRAEFSKLMGAEVDWGD